MSRRGGSLGVQTALSHVSRRVSPLAARPPMSLLMDVYGDCQGRGAVPAAIPSPEPVRSPGRDDVLASRMIGRPQKSRRSLSAWLVGGFGRRVLLSEAVVCDCHGGGIIAALGTRPSERRWTGRYDYFLTASCAASRTLSGTHVFLCSGNPL